MAVPKKKPSNRLTGLGRSAWLRLGKNPRLQACEHCGALKLPHRVCLHCGYYQGEEEIIITTEAPGETKA